MGSIDRAAIAATKRLITRSQSARLVLKVDVDVAQMKNAKGWRSRLWQDSRLDRGLRVVGQRYCPVEGGIGDLRTHEHGRAKIMVAQGRINQDGEHNMGVRSEQRLANYFVLDLGRHAKYLDDHFETSCVVFLDQLSSCRQDGVASVARYLVRAELELVKPSLAVFVGRAFAESSELTSAQSSRFAKARADQAKTQAHKKQH